MYKVPKYSKSQIKSIETMEGESIELKVERIISNKEPIKDGAPEIFTERAQGVLAAYNIRTDRWEIAADAMDKVSGSIKAKREEKGRIADEEKAIKESGKLEVGDQSTHGKVDTK